ncbi:MAG: DUF4397 domain-containing protein [Anaerolineae bacterium]
MHLKIRRLLIASLAAVSVVAALIFCLLRGAPADAQGPSTGQVDVSRALSATGKTTTGEDDALARLSPRLLPQARAGGQGTVYVSVLARDGTSLDGIAERWRPLKIAIGQNRILAAKVRQDRLVKLASLPGVAGVMPTAPTAEERAQERSAAAQRKTQAAAGANKPATAPMKADAPDLWYSTQALGANRAAANGYDGSGVIVGVNDDGVDFGHPDLQGTYATDPHPDSPYYGFPLVYDDESAAAYVLTDGDPTGTNYASSAATFSAGVPYGMTGTVQIQVPGYIGDATVQPVLTPTTVTETITFRNTSRSGVIHYGVHPDSSLWRVEDIGGATFTVPAVFLLTDDATAGVYDSVYVDLGRQSRSHQIEATYDFTAIRPARLGPGQDPTVARDLDGDGLDDISGGIIYFIADGFSQVPILDWLWGASDSFPPPEAGALVAFFGDYGGFWHGTSVASQIVGQGRIHSRFGQDTSVPDLRGVTDGASVINGETPGLAPGAKIFASTYLGDYPQWVAMTYGYDGHPDSGDDAQILSNSWGDTGFPQSMDAGGFATQLNAMVPNVLIIASASNGGAGYGTMSAPGTAGTVLAVGAATQFGTDTSSSIISSTVQITNGNPASFTSRGPDLRGRPGVAVVATGDSASGAYPLNLSIGPDGRLNGDNAWLAFSGTSQAAPQAAAVAALVYQAYHERTGTTPTWSTARALLQGTAGDVGQNPAIQGAGEVDADQATAAAGGLYAAAVAPGEWQVGDYRGTEYLAFPNIAHRGQSYSQVYTLTNSSPVTLTYELSGDTLTPVDSQEWTLQTNQTKESRYSPYRPDYLILPEKISIPADTDMMRVELAQPFSSFCNEDPTGLHIGCGRLGKSGWSLSAYQWLDWNHNGRVWTDLNQNGVVNTGELDLPGTLPGQTTPDPNTSRELNPLGNAWLGGNSQDLRIFRPTEQGADGLTIGVSHQRYPTGAPPTDTLKLKATYYRRQPWAPLTLDKQSLTLAPGETATFRATFSVPNDWPLGYYEGSIRVKATPPGSHDAGVRFLHAAAGLGPVDVYVDNGATPAVSNLALGAIGPDATIDLYAGSHVIRVTPHGSPASAAILYQDVTVAEGTEYTLAAVTTASGPALQTIVDGNRSIGAGQSRVRFGQLSPDLGKVDVYANGRKLFSDLDYHNVARYATLPNGTYTLTVTHAGSATPLLTLGPTSLTGASLTAYAVGPAGALQGVTVAGRARTHFPTHASELPVVANIAAASDLGVGNAVRIGGTPPTDGTYDNGRVFGLTDWLGNGDATQGDWRSFYVDVPDTAATTGAKSLIHTVWPDYPTDIDVAVYGPQARRTENGQPVDEVGAVVNPAVSGPYDLALKARSVDTLHDADGSSATPGDAYSFQTSTGSTAEWLSAPLTKGLNLFAMHNVLYGGQSPSGVPFTTTVGSAVISPTAVAFTAPGPTGAFPVSLTASLDLDGLAAQAYGLSAPSVYHDAVGQSTPPGSLSDPNGNKTYPVTVRNSALLDIQLQPNGSFTGYDVDLYLQVKNTSGFWVTLTQSASASASEHISMPMPAPGEYRVLVNGYNVPPGASYTLTILNIDGTDLQVTGISADPLPAGTATHFTVRYNANFIGTRQGIIYFGPKDAPTTFHVPVTITGTRAYLFMPLLQR